MDILLDGIVVDQTEGSIGVDPPSILGFTIGF